MKRLRKWVLIFAMAGPTVTNLSCTSAVWRQLRNAAIDGASSFVEQATLDMLDPAIGSSLLAQ